jgi:hypothetical protein
MILAALAIIIMIKAQKVVWMILANLALFAFTNGYL